MPAHGSCVASVSRKHHIMLRVNLGIPQEGNTREPATRVLLPHKGYRKHPRLGPRHISGRVSPLFDSQERDSLLPWPRQLHLALPKRLLRKLDPPLGPPPPRLPCRFASSLIHASRNLRSASFRPSDTLVCICASPASKLSSVGMELIIYSRPRPAAMTSGASYSTVQYPTPPSASPTPDWTSS